MIRSRTVRRLPRRPTTVEAQRTQQNGRRPTTTAATFRRIAQPAQLQRCTTDTAPAPVPAAVWSPARKFLAAFAVVTAFGGCDQGCSNQTMRCNGPRHDDERCVPAKPGFKDDMPRGRFIFAPPPPPATRATTVAGARTLLHSLLETAEDAG
ncbi:MAG: hypothetical protein HY696_05175 [Deltaproteobacteria bacterium]|nr:hypothetical protein [Deltaproteobacteria bacterium]